MQSLISFLAEGLLTIVGALTQSVGSVFLKIFDFSYKFVFNRQRDLPGSGLSLVSNTLFRVEVQFTIELSYTILKHLRVLSPNGCKVNGVCNSEADEGTLGLPESKVAMFSRRSSTSLNLVSQSHLNQLEGSCPQQRL